MRCLFQSLLKKKKTFKDFFISKINLSQKWSVHDKKKKVSSSNPLYLILYIALFYFLFFYFLLFLLGTRDLRLKSESVVNTHFAFWQKEVKSEIEIVLFPTILANATFMFANLTLMQTNKKPLFLELHILMYCFLVKRQFKMKITKKPQNHNSKFLSHKK
jgi:hypothetical protein